MSIPLHEQRDIWGCLTGFKRRGLVCLVLLTVLALSLLTRHALRAADIVTTNAFAPATSNAATPDAAPATAPAPTILSAVSEGMWSTYPHPYWEFILRGVIVYIFILVLLRMTGKRQVGQLAPFDLVLLLVLSNAVQNAMNGGDNSITGGMISAVTLVSLNYFVGFLTFKSKTLEGIIEGKPIILVHNGKIDHRAMNAARMTIHELNSALRAGSCCGAHEVKIAVLENGGNITVIRHDHPHDHPATPANHKQEPKP